MKLQQSKGQNKPEESRTQENPNPELAGMGKDQQHEIANNIGRAAFQRRKAHEFSTEESRVAGRKGNKGGGKRW